MSSPTLLASGERVRAVSRNPAADFGPGLEVAAADLERPETLPAALAGAGQVFLYAKPDGLEGFVTTSARSTGTRPDRALTLPTPWGSRWCRLMEGTSRGSAARVRSTNPPGPSRSIMRVAAPVVRPAAGAAGRPGAGRPRRLSPGLLPTGPSARGAGCGAGSWLGACNRVCGRGRQRALVRVVLFAGADRGCW